VTDRQPDGGVAVSLAVATEYAPRRRVDVLELDMGDGIVLYDPESRLVHHLNPSASLLWNLSDGDASVEQLVRETSEELHLEPSEVREQFVGLVAEMDALGLLDDMNDTTDPTEDPGDGRDGHHA
jgi:PqqD family protein of HPr-rel-A system